MAGLCNICTENGAENFNRLDVLLASLEELWYKANTTECPIPDILLRAKRYKGYLLSDFISNLEIHSECATHCMGWYLSPEPTCSSKEHPYSCHSCNERCSLVRGKHQRSQFLSQINNLVINIVIVALGTSQNLFTSTFMCWENPYCSKYVLQ